MKPRVQQVQKPKVQPQVNITNISPLQEEVPVEEVPDNLLYDGIELFSILNINKDDDIYTQFELVKSTPVGSTQQARAQLGGGINMTLYDDLKTQIISKHNKNNIKNNAAQNIINSDRNKTKENYLINENEIIDNYINSIKYKLIDELFNKQNTEKNKIVEKLEFHYRYFSSR